MPFTSIIYRIQLSRGRSQGFEPFSHNWQEPVIANSFPKGPSDWTRVYVLLRFPSDRSRASLSLVLEVGQRAGPGHVGARGSIIIVFQFQVVESWSFTKRVVFKASCSCRTSFRCLREVGACSFPKIQKGIFILPPKSGYPGLTPFGRVSLAFPKSFFLAWWRLR